MHHAGHVFRRFLRNRTTWRSVVKSRHATDQILDDRGRLKPSSVPNRTMRPYRAVVFVARTQLGSGAWERAHGCPQHYPVHGGWQRAVSADSARESLGPSGSHTDSPLMSPNLGPAGLRGARFQAVFVRSRSAGIGWGLWGFLPHFLPQRSVTVRAASGAGNHEISLHQLRYGLAGSGRHVHRQPTAPSLVISPAGNALAGFCPAPR
jgi:hypothetical protein